MIASRYKVDISALETAVQEAGVSEADFCRRAGVGHNLMTQLRAGPSMVSEGLAEKLKRGLAAIGKGEDAGYILLCLPQGSVKILGDAEDLRRRLRQAARTHGMTTRTYLDKCFELSEDPLEQLAKAAAVV